jgi:hypothetical protein
MLSQLVGAGRAKVQVALDEGGVRCAWRKGKGYVPYELLADANVEEGALGGAKLVLVGKDGEELGLDVDEPLAAHRAIVAHLVQASAARPAPAGLAREGRAIDAWLDDVMRRAEGGGYREAGVDHAALAALLADEHAAAEGRAAAAFVLVGSASADLLRACARAFVEHALPPLVLVAGWLAAGGLALVPDDVAADAKGYLARGDAIARRGDDAARAPLVAAALADVLAEARATVHVVPAKRRRLYPAAGNGMDMRWVGRTWNI